jgi:hypothetical protein
MDLRELKVTTAKNKLKITTTALITTFVLLLKCGLDQANGNIRGPTQRKPITSDELLKYHLLLFLFSIEIITSGWP